METIPACLRAGKGAGGGALCGFCRARGSAQLVAAGVCSLVPCVPEGRLGGSRDKFLIPAF